MLLAVLFLEEDVVVLPEVIPFFAHYFYEAFIFVAG